jgi:prephenate dehydrogenase
MSPPELWSPIVAGNQSNLLEALDAFTRRLAALRSAVADGDIFEIFRSGQSFAAQIQEPDRLGNLLK